MRKKLPSIYARAIIALVSALIGTFIVPIVALLVIGNLDFNQLGTWAGWGAFAFALLGFVFPKSMEKILFVLTLFQ